MTRTALRSIENKQAVSELFGWFNNILSIEQLFYELYFLSNITKKAQSFHKSSFVENIQLNCANC